MLYYCNIRFPYRVRKDFRNIPINILGHKGKKSYFFVFEFILSTLKFLCSGLTMWVDVEQNGVVNGEPFACGVSYKVCART